MSLMDEILGRVRAVVARGVYAVALVGLAQISSVGAVESLEYRPIANAVPVPIEPSGPARAEDVEAFVDGFMASRMATAKIAGAAVAVVKDGQLLFAKGYGYEDAERRVPVDPQRTLFRIASISKLFTWIAAMQLVEQGKLDLDRDVNTYLTAFQIPATFAEPVTLRHLMTHSAGLDDITYFYPTPGKHDTAMQDWLAAHMPPRIRPPTSDFSSGTNAAYSNTGAALAGHLVEAISGLTFDEYVERHILGPLGMNSTSSREPLPAMLARRMSGGYLPEGGGFIKGDFEFVKPLAPAGSISATATDMGRLMLALLNEGELDGKRVLAPETVRKMLTRALSPDPAVNGTALGFYENYINGRRLIGHGGDTRYFHSNLSLLSEGNLGIFAVVNTGGDAGWVGEEAMRAFIQHYFPARLPKIEPPKDAAARNARYVGTYRTLAHTFTTYERIFSGLSDNVVTALPDGRLLFADPLEGSMHRWIEVGDGVFRTENDDIFVAFKGEPGRPASHLVGPFSPTASERIYWYDSLNVHAAVIVLAFVAFITMAVSVRRHYAADRADPTLLRWARPVLASGGALLVIAIVNIALHFSSMSEVALLHIGVTLTSLCVLPVIAAVIFTLIAWARGAWRTIQRVHYTAVTLFALAFLLILNYWNLIGYRFG